MKCTDTKANTYTQAHTTLKKNKLYSIWIQSKHTERDSGVSFHSRVKSGNIAINAGVEIVVGFL